LAAITPPSRPKVLRIIARLNVGGPALHCVLLSEKLNSEFETTLVSGNVAVGEEDFIKLFQIQADGYQMIKLPELYRQIRIWGDLKALWALIRLIRKERPDIVHTHTAKAGFLGRIAAILTGVPVVVHTFHGHVLRGYFSQRVSKLIRQAERWLAMGTSAIITLSPQLKKELSEDFRIARPEKFRIIPLGRNLKPFLEMPRKHGKLYQEFKISPETYLMGIIGRLVPIKDHSTLFAACALLPKDQPWKLLVIGEGPLRDSLTEEVRRLGLADRILFTGWRQDLETIYSDLDLSIISSINEGTPLSLIESFAAGCPAVATEVGGVADLFTGRQLQVCHEGRLVPKEDPESLATAIGEMISNPQYRVQMSQAARERAKAFTDEELAKRMRALYHELLANKWKSPLPT